MRIVSGARVEFPSEEFALALASRCKPCALGSESLL